MKTSEKDTKASVVWLQHIVFDPAASMIGSGTSFSKT